MEDREHTYPIYNGSDVLTYKVHTNKNIELTQVTGFAEADAKHVWHKKGWSWELMGINLPIETILEMKKDIAIISW